jgi:hypothetical protein
VPTALHCRRCQLVDRGSVWLSETPVEPSLAALVWEWVAASLPTPPIDCTKDRGADSSSFACCSAQERPNSASRCARHLQHQHHRVREL